MRKFIISSLLFIIAISIYAATITTGTKLYLNPNGQWQGTTFTAYFFTGGTAGPMVTMQASTDKPGHYEVTSPGDYGNVIFIKGTTWNGDDNQTDDLTWPGDQDVYSITEFNGNGTWYPIVPPAPPIPPQDPDTPLSDIYDVTPVCTDDGGITFPSDIGSPKDAVEGPNYSCLTSVYYPTFYFLKIKDAGNIVFDLESTRDVDFVLWGPYDNKDVKLSDLTGDKVDTSSFGNQQAGCSFDSSPTEKVKINNAQPGKYYILCISDYNASQMQYPTPTEITLTTVPSASTGTTDCTIISECDISKFTTQTTDINYTNNTYSIKGEVKFSNAPTTGTLTITDVVSGKTQQVSAPFTSPFAYQIDGIDMPDPSQSCQVTVSFSDGSCDKELTYTSPPIDTPINIDLCTNEGTYELNADDTNTYNEITWTPTTGLDDPTKKNPIFTVPTTPQVVTYIFEGKNISANKITNGDFEAGNSGFSSDYTYSTSSIYQENTYCVNKEVLHSSSNCKNDHTTGNGKFMSANGGPTANTKIWGQENISITPNTDYIFYAWLMCWDGSCDNPAKLQFSINDELIGEQFSPTTTCQWEQVYVIWNSGTNTSVNIKLLNQQTAHAGNDFSIDDVYFAEVTSVRKKFNLNIEVCSFDVEMDSTINTKCNGRITSIFDLKYTENQVKDVQRSPAFPSDGASFTVSQFDEPLFENSTPITSAEFANGAYIGLVDKGRLGDLSDATLKVSFENAAQGKVTDTDEIRLTSTILYNSDGSIKTIISEYGMLWGLGDKGFLYTSGEDLGTFFFTDAIPSDPLTYTPDHAIVTSLSDLENYIGTSNTTGGTRTSTCNGTATATPVGGTAPFTYLWNDPAAQTTATATGLCGGDYEVTVTDAGGFTVTKSVTIADYKPDVAHPNVLGQPEASLPLDLAALGKGIPTGGTFSGCNIADGKTITALPAGNTCQVNYEINENGCKNDVDFTVSFIEDPCLITNIEVITSDTKCEDNTYSITGNVEFENAPDTGKLLITEVQSGNSVEIAAPFTSPAAFEITGLDADDATRQVKAQFVP